MGGKKKKERKERELGCYELALTENQGARLWLLLIHSGNQMEVMMDPNMPWRKVRDTCFRCFCILLRTLQSSPLQNRPGNSCLTTEQSSLGPVLPACPSQSVQSDQLLIHKWFLSSISQTKIPHTIPPAPFMDQQAMKQMRRNTSPHLNTSVSCAPEPASAISEGIAMLISHDNHPYENLILN